MVDGAALTTLPAQDAQADHHGQCQSNRDRLDNGDTRFSSSMRHHLSPFGPGRPNVSSPLVAGFFLAVFFACFSSVLTTDYGYQGDYVLLVEGPQGRLVKKMFTEGRPINALGNMLLLQGATDVEHLRYLRLVGVLGIVLLTWCVARTLSLAGWNRFQCVCVAVIMGTALPFQAYAARAECVLFPVAALAAGLAFLLSERAFESRRRRSQWLLAAGASLALLAALAIYQPAAMFFWVFAAVTLLKPNATPRDVLRRFRWYCVIALAGMSAGYVVYVLSPVMVPGSSVRTGLVRDIPTKVVWFLSVYLPDTLNFFLPSPSYQLFPGAGSEFSIHLYRKISNVLHALNISLLPSHEQAGMSASYALAVSPPGALSFVHKILDVFIAYGVFAFIGGGLWLYFRGTRRERLWQCGIAVSLLLLSCTPNLVVEKHISDYRTMSPPVSVIVLCAYFAFQGYAGRLCRLISPARVHAALGVAAVACTLSAAWHVHTFFVVPQVRELTLMRSELAQSDMSRIQGIRIILHPRWQQNTPAPFLWREFGNMSAVHSSWARSMASLLLRELPPEHANLPIECVDFNDATPPGGWGEGGQYLVVDMRKLGLLSPTADVSTRGTNDP